MICMSKVEFKCDRHTKYAAIDWFHHSAMDKIIQPNRFNIIYNTANNNRVIRMSNLLTFTSSGLHDTQPPSWKFARKRWKKKLCTLHTECHRIKLIPCMRFFTLWLIEEHNFLILYPMCIKLHLGFREQTSLCSSLITYIILIHIRIHSSNDSTHNSKTSTTIWINETMERLSLARAQQSLHLLQPTSNRLIWRWRVM